MMVDGFHPDLWIALAERTKSPAEPNSMPKLLDGKLLRNLIEYQERLRARSKSRFRFPERWLWTSQLLEQASDERSAELMASCFPANVPVVDICCGAGADSVALAKRGPVSSIDKSLVASVLAAANLRLHGLEGQVLTREADLSRDIQNQWVHIDPDRRAQGKRTTGVEFFDPPPEFLADSIQRSVGGSIKVAPATEYHEFRKFCIDHHRGEVAEKIGLQFISWGGSVRQQRWWWNVEKFPSQTTTISVASRGPEWAHWTCDPNHFDFDSDCLIDEPSKLTGFLGDTDPVVRAAGVQPQFASGIGTGIVGNVFGYLHTSQASVPDSPFINWFEIEEVIAFDRKKVRRLLQSRQVGIIEIKTRNVDIPLESLRKELKLVGEASRTLLITRCGKSVIAILARRVPKAITACQSS